MKLVVSYDGTDYCGFAAQTGQRTVQSTLTDIVRQISGEEIEIFGASRTDSGAHARHQVVHLDTSWSAPVERIPRILNNLLPCDLAVQKAKVVPESFHARFSAQDRFYRYRIRRSPRDPHQTRFVHDSWRRLNTDLMNEVAQLLAGSHDFRAFSEEVEAEANAIRVVHSISVKAVGPETWIDVVGNAFMRGMMRRISGALFEVGRGRRDPQEIEILLDPERRDKLMWPVVLPAKGLCLMRVRYGRHPKDLRERYRTKTISQETGR